MADYDIRPLQLRILKILLAVDKVCKEHGLRYYIMAGTMLGAVRHKGFIPWDDDLDIGMPRADYDLLMSHSKEWLPKYGAQNETYIEGWEKSTSNLLIYKRLCKI